MRRTLEQCRYVISSKIDLQKKLNILKEKKRNAVATQWAKSPKKHSEGVRFWLFRRFCTLGTSYNYIIASLRKLH